MSTDADELLKVEGLSKFFPVVRGVFGKTVGHVRAVDDVSFSIRRGETLGLVGESGCGKTTAGRSILRLIEPSQGRVWFDGTELMGLSQRELRSYRRRMQIVFQDPFGSLNQRMRVVDIVGEAIERHGLASGVSVEREVAGLLRKVGLSASWLYRYPHEFSGGQRQRIGVARAIAVSPDLIVCDEAVSALDVSIQAQVINLLIDLRREMNLAYLFIAHDLSVVRHISHRVAVMYLGEIVELAGCAELFARPAHPYTRALLSAIPVPDPRQRRRRVVLEGDVPSPLNPPAGCHFHTRCPAAVERCTQAPPPVVLLEGGQHQVRCIHAEGLEAEPGWYEVLDRRLTEAGAARTDKLGSNDRRLPMAAPGPLEPLPAEVPGAGGQSGVALQLPAQGPAVAEAAVPEFPDVGARSSSQLPMGDYADPRWTRPLSPLASNVLAVLVVLTFTVGLALLLFGSSMLAVPFLLAGGVGLVQAPPPPLARALRHRPIQKLMALALLMVLGSRWGEPVRRASSARQQLRWLSDEVTGHLNNVGSVPQTLGELRWRTIEHFGLGTARDPWGRAFRYLPHGDGKGFDLSSDGADGVPSADDVRL